MSRRLLAAVLVAMASVAAAVALYITWYRTDVQTDAAAASSAVDAASEGTTALLTYRPETLDSDLTAAKAHLTGEFLTYYRKFSDEILQPAAKDRAVTAEASVVRAALVEIHPGTAKVLVYVNQTTASRDRPDAAPSASSVMVSLIEVDGRWLISAFDPL